MEYLVRIATTGLGFLLFTLMGLSFRFLACPLLRLTIRNPESRQVAAHRVVYESFRFFLFVVERLRVLDLEIQGKQKLQGRGLLLCASHPTLIDVVILMSMIPNASCIVKAQLYRSFVLQSPIATAGYIANDSGEELVKQCSRCLQNGTTLIIFPEGTRTTPGKPPRCKHGAARIALASGRDITPVRITCEPPALMKGIPWYTIPKRRMHITVEVLDPIAVAPFTQRIGEEELPVVVRALTRQLESVLFGFASRKPS